MLGMLGLSGIKMALLAVLATAIAGAYWHYSIVKGERDAALVSVGALQIETQIQDQTIATLELGIDAWVAHADALRQTNEDMAKAQHAATAEQRRLNDVLSKHDLSALSVAKPGLLERRINSGTRSVLRMFECASGGRNDDCRGDPPAGEPASTP